jgi:sugar transferase (PEP-CTERM system associated)
VAAEDRIKVAELADGRPSWEPPGPDPLNTKFDFSLESAPAPAADGATPEPRSWRVSKSSVQFFGQHIDLWSLILGGVDFMLLCAAVHFAAVIRHGGDFSVLAAGAGAPWLESMLFATVALSSLVAMGLYNRRLDSRTASVIARMVVGLIIGAMAMAILTFLIGTLRLGPAMLALAICVALPMLATSRLVFVQVVGRDRFARRVLVYGTGAKAAELLNLRVRQDLRGFQVVGYVPTEGCKPVVPKELRINPGEALLDFVRDQDVDEVVVAMEDRRRGLPVHQLLDCRLAGVPVTDVLGFMERETGKVELSMLYPSWLIYTDGINRRGMVRVITRVLDLVAAGALLVLAAPLMLVTSLLIWIESGFRGPVLYAQTRVGLEGQLFTIYKFRSMREDAEKDGAKWAQENDPRVTRVGRVIRATRIDELPQLLNVLMGSMSFVGPRPERPEFIASLSAKIPYYRERHCVKPGITGWAQLCYPYGASEHDALEKLQYDLYYVKKKSVLFDLMILLQTAEVVLWRKGSR